MNDEMLKAKMNKLGRDIHLLEDLQLQFDYEHKDLIEEIEDLKNDLKPEILARKESVESDVMKAQYRKGAEKWETKWLEGYSIDHPEILKYKTVGKPTVAFSVKDFDWEND